MTAIDRFFVNMRDSRVVFIGVGVSHNDVIRLFLDKGIAVTVCDRKSKEGLGAIYEEFSARGVRFVLEENYLDALEDADVIFRSPGMYYNHPAIKAARDRGAAVTSEMEAFFELCPCKLYAVTGSDGKTTTTSVIAELLRVEGRRVHLGGNIGKALLPLVETIRPEDAAVVELSSFQLISMTRSPDVAVITNISPNHLDVHGTMDEYIRAKCNILLHQSPFGRAVLNARDAETDRLSAFVRGRLDLFSSSGAPARGAYVNGEDVLCYHDNGVHVPLLRAEDIRIPGRHNVENYLAAITAVYGEVRSETIVKVAKEFAGVEHRIEFVREHEGIRWYNDSIATSPTRVIAGLRAFSQKLIVIAGGYDKKIPFEPLAPALCEHAKALILTGVTAPKIEAAVRGCSAYHEEELPILHAESLEDAVRIAKEIAQAGDIVTLSPACASFDRYPNFEARGMHFKRLVQAL